MFFPICKSVETLHFSFMSNTVVNTASVPPRASQTPFTALCASQLLLLIACTYDSSEDCPEITGEIVHKGEEVGELWSLCPASPPIPHSQGITLALTDQSRSMKTQLSDSGQLWDKTHSWAPCSAKLKVHSARLCLKSCPCAWLLSLLVLLP